jgi:hypothetical protein
VDRLELRVREASLLESRRRTILVVQERLEVAERRHEFVRGRRNKTSVPRARATNPVLRSPELPGSLVGPSPAAHQHFVQLPNQP